MSTEQEELDPPLLIRRPKSDCFFQQNLAAWHPFFRVRTGASIMAIIGISFILIGIALLKAADQLDELVVDYTDCPSIDLLQNCSHKPCTCTKLIELPNEMRGQVYMYYGLHHFYQNHRSYISSIDDPQLRGLKLDVNDLASCFPLVSFSSNTTTLPYLPCGLIANSIFNDTFTLSYDSNNTAVKVPTTKEGIAWQSDVQVKFGKLTPDAVAGTEKPPNWPKSAMERSSGAFTADEELMVWMRPAALPKFRKLHRIIEHNATTFKSGLPAGRYTLDIVYNYPVAMFGGRKLFILANTGFTGGKNPTLAVGYLITGTVHLICAIAFVGFYYHVQRGNPVTAILA